MTTIIISNNPTNLQSALNEYASTATVEAEYGERVVQGSVLTLAHHGPRSGRPCPCGISNFPKMGIDVIGISHIDLDTLGGILAILGRKREDGWRGLFWGIATKVDTMGVHKLHEIIEDFGGNNPRPLEALNAFWAFSESPEGRIYPPRDGSAIEVDLSKHLRVLEVLLDSPKEDLGEQYNLWGPEAGGHPGIAGSPRGQKMDFEAARNAAKELAGLIK